MSCPHGQGLCVLDAVIAGASFEARRRGRKPMINILIGAAIGAVVNVGAYCAIQLWKGQPMKGKAIGAAAVGGIVAGALAGTTFGASLLGGTATNAAEFLAFDGAAAS